MARAGIQNINGFPVAGAALDFIKIMAAVLMVVDHWDDMILDRTAPYLMIIGRTVFPLFCYATACAILRGGREKALIYGAKIMLIAILVEPVSQITRGHDTANILFTLSLGAIVLYMLSLWSHRARMAFFAFALATVLLPSQWEYGIIGACIPAAMYFVLNGENKYIPWLVALLVFANLTDMGSYIGDFTPMVFISLSLTAAATVVFPWIVIMLAGHVKGEQRLMPKYFLHVFYPAHMIVLAMIRPFV